MFSNRRIWWDFQFPALTTRPLPLGPVASAGARPDHICVEGDPPAPAPKKTPPVAGTEGANIPPIGGDG